MFYFHLHKKGRECRTSVLRFCCVQEPPSRIPGLYDLSSNLYFICILSLSLSIILSSVRGDGWNMTARTNLERSTREGRSIKKKRGRFIAGLAAVLLLVFCFMKFTSLLETATAKQHGQGHQAAANSSGARPQGKIVYLTFDDGPSEWTGKFLDILQRHGVKATFLCRNQSGTPQLAK